LASRLARTLWRGEAAEVVSAPSTKLGREEKEEENALQLGVAASSLLLGVGFGLTKRTAASGELLRPLHCAPAGREATGRTGERGSEKGEGDACKRVTLHLAENGRLLVVTLLAAPAVTERKAQVKVVLAEERLEGVVRGASS
jgi:hypothetical protein